MRPPAAWVSTWCRRLSEGCLRETGIEDPCVSASDPGGPGSLTLIGANRASVSAECVTTFNDLKLQKKLKYIIYKLSDDNKEIIVEESSEDPEWDHFREKLINAKTVRSPGSVPRAAIVPSAAPVQTVSSRKQQADLLRISRVTPRDPDTPSTTSTTALPTKASGRTRTWILSRGDVDG